MNKRIIAGIMAVTLVFGGAAVLPSQAFSDIFSISASAEVLEKDGFKYEIESGAIVIKGYTGTSGDVVIPAEIDGQVVTSIDSYAFKNSNITSVTISDGIQYVGYETFMNCKSLTKVTIPGSIIEMKSSVFQECKSLKDITFANDYSASLSDHMFANCTSIEKITLPAELSTIENAAFAECNSLTEITIPSKVTKIASNAFWNCKSLKKANIPAEVSEIGNYAFQNCSTLSDLTFDESQKPLSLGYCVFKECANLKEVALPGRIVKVETEIFRNDKNLSKVTIGEGYSADISDEMFRDCTNLAAIEIPEGVTTIGDASFTGCTRLKSATLPESLTTIEPSAFSECTVLEAIAIPGNVSKLGNFSFSGCERLKTLTFAESDIALSLGYSVFQNCSKIDAVALPARTTTIASGTFMNCSGIKTLTFAEGFKSVNIPESMFQNCTGITSVDIPKVEKIDENAFEGCTSLEKLTLPDGLNTIGARAFNGCVKLAAVNIPATVTTIGNYAFCEDTGLKEVTFENSDIALDIGYEAFSRTGIKELTVPARLNTAGGGVFSHNSMLEKVEFEDGYDADVFEEMFYSCPKLRRVLISEGAREIDRYAIHGNGNLRYVRIPKSVDKIAEKSIGYVDGWGENKASRLVIGGYKGTAAEEYANANGFEFFDLDSGEPEPADELSTDEKAAADVQAKLEALPTKNDVTLDDKSSVSAARDAYDKLTEDQKKLIGEDLLKKLTDAEAKIKELGGDKVDGKLGDVNNDGKINSGDITKTAAHIKGLKTLSADEKLRADVSKDGKINSGDITKIAAHIKGLKTIKE